MKLLGRTAIITGGATGIGRVFAQRMAADGANVVIADLKGAEDAAAELVTAGAKALGLTVDITSEDDTREMARASLARFGGIEILVNNAALFSTLRDKPFDQIDAEEWLRVMAVNTMGPFLCAKAVAKTMKEKGHGRIINIASTAPLKGVPLMAHYVSSKGAVIAFTRCLARELGEWNITVNAVAPGLTLSDQILKNAGHVERLQEVVRNSRSLKRDAYPQDIAGTVSFLASDDASFMTGQTLCVEGGSIFV